MTFNQEIFNILSNEVSISSLVSGFNHYHLPDNFNRDNDYIIYHSRIVAPYNTMTLENYGDEYNLTVKAVSKSPQDIYTIAQAVKDYLIGYSSAAFRSIIFERDVPVWSEEEKVWILSLDFTIDFCNV